MSTSDDRVDSPPSPRSFSVAALLLGGVAVVLLLLALLVAITLPYGNWDAMALGTWSRLIAEHWPTLHFPYRYAGDYQRPLFYVLQGTVWHIFGFHVALGAVLSLLFGLLLIVTVGWLASRTIRPYRWLAAVLAVVVLLAITDFDNNITAGLTDIPVAAMVTLTAALLCLRRLGRAQLPLAALAAALSVLTKPSALPALAGALLFS